MPHSLGESAPIFSKNPNCCSVENARNKIRNRIRRLRFDSDEMTQEELANRAGCTRQTIIALEQGKYVPSIELAFKIAKAFAVTLEEVFQYEDLSK
ncbi:helix-turn-helix transcriptional regulator [Chloroflexota bacterium]